MTCHGYGRANASIELEWMNVRDVSMLWTTRGPFLDDMTEWVAMTDDTPGWAEWLSLAYRQVDCAIDDLTCLCRRCVLPNKLGFRSSDVRWQRKILLEVRQSRKAEWKMWMRLEFPLKACRKRVKITTPHDWRSTTVASRILTWRECLIFSPYSLCFISFHSSNIFLISDFIYASNSNLQFSLIVLYAPNFRLLLWQIHDSLIQESTTYKFMIRHASTVIYLLYMIFFPV